MSKRSEYLDHIYQQINEEFFLILNSSEYWDVEDVPILYEMWQKRDFEKIYDYLKVNLEKAKVEFIVPEEKADIESYREFVLLRLFSLFEISREILEVIPFIHESETYQRLNLRYQHEGFDLDEIASLIEVAQNFLNDQLEKIKKTSIPMPLKKMVNRLIAKMTKANKKKQLDLYFDDFYDLFDYIDVILENMEGQEYNWSGYVIEKANKFFLWLLIFQSMIYFILMYKEIYLQIQEKKTNIHLQSDSSILEQRLDAVQELELLKTLDKYHDN